MTSSRKTNCTISGAVKEFISENNIQLDCMTANLICEKIFTDKKEYTLELCERIKTEKKHREILESDIDFIKSILSQLLALMKFSNPGISHTIENDLVVIKISVHDKDGLLIGKNGQNLLAMQYLLSIILEKKLKKHVPFAINVDTYMEKRSSYLKTLARTMAERAMQDNTEAITEYLPSYERKIIHEEISAIQELKTFSVGKGPYKKVVITSLL